MSELCDNFKWQKIHVIGFFEIKGEMDKNIVILGDFNTLYIYPWREYPGRKSIRNVSWP